MPAGCAALPGSRFRVPVELRDRGGRLIARPGDEVPDGPVVLSAGTQAGGAAMTRFPLRYAHQNILVGQGEARAALFRVDTVSYPFLAAADKREWLRRLARFAFAVEADFSLWRVCRAYPAERVRRAGRRAAGRPRAVRGGLAVVLNGHEAHLRELRSLRCPRSIWPSRWPPTGRRAWSVAPTGCADASRSCSASAADVPIPGGGDRDADRRRGARVPARRGVPARPARHHPGAAVAAAPRELPRRRRARAR